MTAEEVDQIIFEVDANGDGEISFEEFVLMMTGMEDDEWEGIEISTIVKVNIKLLSIIDHQKLQDDSTVKRDFLRWKSGFIDTALY